MPLFRFPLNRGKALIRHYASSSAQRHNVGASPLNPPQFSKKKITAWFYGLPLLLRKKARQRSHVKNYRFTRFFTAYLTTNFFRLCVPLFVRNAGAQNLCLREAGSFELLFSVFHFTGAYGAFFVSAALPTFFGYAVLPSVGTQTLGASVCGECEVLSFFSSA